MTRPLTDAINALTTYANEITGADDPDLSSAVRTLCDGYGQGGGGSVAQDAEGYIVLPVDGGGAMSKLELLREITLTEPVTHRVEIDVIDYVNDYSLLVCEIDVTLSANDYLYGKYRAMNGSEQFSNWIAQNTKFTRVGATRIVFGEGEAITTLNGGGWITNTNKFLRGFIFDTWVSSTNFQIGSKFRIYGAKYAEM